MSETARGGLATDPFFLEIQEIYEEIGESLPAHSAWPRPGELPDEQAVIRQSGLFDPVEVRQFDWETVYDAESYISLPETFSGHIAMQPWQRERLYGEIRRRLAERSDGRLRRHWGAALHVALRRPGVSDSALPESAVLGEADQIGLDRRPRSDDMP